MRALLALLLSFVLFTGGGCTKAAQPAQEPADAAEQVRATALALLRARQAADRAAVEALLGDPALKTRIGLPSAELILTGYRVVEPLEGEGRPLKTQLFFHEVGKRAGYWLEKLTFAYDGKRYLITDYDLLGQRSVEIAGSQLTMQLPTGESQPWLTLSQLPETFEVEEGVSFGVSRAKFVDVALHPNGETVAFFSGGEVHGFLGLVDAQGQVTGLDLYFEGEGQELAFSPDGNTLAAVVFSPSGLMVLQAYDVANQRRVEVAGVTMADKIARLRWRDGELLFTVTNEGTTESWRWQPGQTATKG